MIRTIKKILGACLMAGVLMANGVSAAAAETAWYGTMDTAANVNFRTGPSAYYGKIAYIPAGTKVELISRFTSGWYVVRHQGNVGYISSSYLKNYQSGQAPVPVEPLKDPVVRPHIVTTRVNFRTGPSTAYSIIGKLEIGQTVNYLDSAGNGWYKVSNAGRIGYVSASYLTPLILPKPAASASTIGSASDTYVVTALSDIRTGPGTSFTRAARLTPGTLVGVVSVRDSWAAIQYQEASSLRTGYVNTSFISPQIVANSVVPKIGIASNPNNHFYYAEAIARAGGQAVMLPAITSPQHAAEVLDSLDGILFPGGRVTGASDTYLIQEALAKDKPTLGICLGFQTVLKGSGGTLTDLMYLDNARFRIHRDPLDKVFVFHNIDLVPGTKLSSLAGSGIDNVNSMHRYIAGSLGSNLTVTARSSDGTIEAIERTDKTFVMGLSFHPERMVAAGDSVYMSVFLELVDQARLQRTR